MAGNKHAIYWSVSRLNEVQNALYLDWYRKNLHNYRSTGELMFGMNTDTPKHQESVLKFTEFTRPWSESGFDVAALQRVAQDAQVELLQF